MFQTTPVILALIVAAFVTFYPQLETTGYCVAGDCPEISTSTQASGGAHGGGAHGTHGPGSAGTCLMAVLIGGSALAAAAAARRAWTLPRSAIPRSLYLAPEPPPPRPGY